MSKNVPFFDLSGGYKIPAFGLGTYWRFVKIDENVVESALEAGYRLFDTATVYETEKNIGNVINRWIKSGKIKREDLFLVTKLPPFGMTPAGVHKYVKQSLENLQVDYIDLYLINSPVGVLEETNFLEIAQKGQFTTDPNTDHVAVWKAMEEEVKAGRLRSIGLSNFNIRQIRRIIDNAKVPVANLQVELHVFHQQKELVDFCKTNNIIVTSYFSLGSPKMEAYWAKLGVKVEVPSILENPVVKEIAAKYGKTTAQILLRHLHEKGILVIPKSSNPERQKQNINIFDFQLQAEDAAKLDGLDEGDAGSRTRTGLKRHPEFEEHPENPFARQ